jgi:hypothetical protein
VQQQQRRPRGAVPPLGAPARRVVPGAQDAVRPGRSPAAANPTPTAAATTTTPGSVNVFGRFFFQKKFFLAVFKKKYFVTAEPSEGRRRSRGGRSRCSQRPAGGSNHQNEPDDHSGGSCRGGQQNQRMCALVSRISTEEPKEGNWDAIGHRLKHVADHLDPDFSKVS